VKYQENERTSGVSCERTFLTTARDIEETMTVLVRREKMIRVDGCEWSSEDRGRVTRPAIFLFGKHR